MVNRLKPLMIVLIIVFVSCSTVSKEYIPSVSVKKLDLKAALIISDELKNSVHKTTVVFYCGYMDYKNNVVSNPGIRSFPIKIEIGLRTEDLFVHWVPYLFKRVDVYKNIEEIKNKENYDYILIPLHVINTYYDENKARNQKILNYGFIGVTGDPVRFNASVEYKLKVLDAKNNDVIRTFTGRASGSNNYGFADCGLLRYGDFFNRPLGLSTKNAFEDLLRNAESELIQLAKAKSEERALPSELALNVRFSDTAGFFPNNSLDAGEDAEVIVAIKNTGKGAGYGTNLEITSDNPKITFDRNINVGDIQPNETKEIKINLKSGLDIESGKASFQFNLKEKRGYDAKRVVMLLPTARLERPQLEIVSSEINDGDTGLAKGNGNGIPESGETVEVTAFIKNQGEGKAIGVNLNGQNITGGIQWVRDSTLIGIIPQGEIVKGKMAFSIPRNFDTKEIAVNLKVSDMRGVGNTEKKVSFAYAKRSPNLHYVYRILSKGGEVKTVTNGEEYEIELMIGNKGEIPARGVMIAINPPSPPFDKGGMEGLHISRSRIDLGDVKEQTSAPAHKITFSVARTFSDVSAPLSLEISQSDFSSVKDSIQIPVEVKRPGLTYKASLLSKNRGNLLEQGEGATLEVQILNEGNLSAEGVKIKIETKDENLKVTGQTEAVIGKIPPLSKGETIRFELKTLRRIKVGDASLNIAITQDDFSPVISQYALRIMEEGAEVFDVASEDRVKGTAAGGSKSAPVINLMTALKGVETITSEESIRLAFEVVDSRNIESVRVEVNGMLIPIDEKGAFQPTKKREIMKNIPLKEGENRIAIYPQERNS